MKTQLGPITKLLQRNGVATFDFYEGSIPTEAGPGVSGMFDGPYYSFFTWPPSSNEDDEQSILEACEDLEDFLVATGPYDGILGFSHGSTLLAEFLCNYARRNPGIEPLCRCAIFLNAIPPFRMGSDGKPVIDYGLLGHFPPIPSLHVIGQKDFVLEYSKILYSSRTPDLATLVTHEKGHEVANNQRTLQEIVKAFEDLSIRIALGH
jgi:hypothetical protein